MFLLAAVLIIAGVALFVAAPLGNGLVGAKRKTTDELDLERNQHERAHAVQGLRELEFDREMGKLSDVDYDTMRLALEDRALTAMTAIEKIRTAKKTAPEKSQPEKKVEGPHLASIKLPPAAPPQVTFSTSGSPSATRRIDPTPSFLRNAQGSATAQRARQRFCPECGTRAAADAKFCAECGLALRAVTPATNWND